MLKQVPVSQENSNLDLKDLDLQVRVFAGIPMGKPTGNPQGPGPMLSPIHFLLAKAVSPTDATEILPSPNSEFHDILKFPSVREH